MDYDQELQFGIFPRPEAESATALVELARLGDEAGLDLIGIQDHPYSKGFLDTWALIAYVLAQTSRVSVFPDVANLPLRPPLMMAKAAASLDVLSGGRFELGLGAGASWDGVEQMGGPRRTPGESVDALEEAVGLIKSFWSGEHGRGGPAPAHDIGIWVGAYKPRMLALTGRLADGWIPSHTYLPPDKVPEARKRVDDAGRDLRRIYNVPGDLEAEQYADFVTELGFDTLIFWFGDGDPRRDIERWASELIPAVREEVRRRRASS